MRTASLRRHVLEDAQPRRGACIAAPYVPTVRGAEPRRVPVASGSSPRPSGPTQPHALVGLRPQHRQLDAHRPGRSARTAEGPPLNRLQGCSFDVTGAMRHPAATLEPPLAQHMLRRKCQQGGLLPFGGNAASSNLLAGVQEACIQRTGGTGKRRQRQSPSPVPLKGAETMAKRAQSRLRHRRGPDRLVPVARAATGGLAPTTDFWCQRPKGRDRRWESRCGLSPYTGRPPLSPYTGRPSLWEAGDV